MPYKQLPDLQLTFDADVVVPIVPHDPDAIDVGGTLAPVAGQVTFVESKLHEPQPPEAIRWPPPLCR